MFIKCAHNNFCGFGNLVFRSPLLIPTHDDVEMRGNGKVASFVSEAQEPFEIFQGSLAFVEKTNVRKRRARN